MEQMFLSSYVVVACDSTMIVTENKIVFKCRSINTRDYLEAGWSESLEASTYVLLELSVSCRENFRNYLTLLGAVKKTEFLMEMTLINIFRS